MKSIRNLIKDNKLEFLLVSQAENRRYLSGFTGSAGYLLIGPDTQILATDFRYIEQVKIQAPDFTLVQISGELSSWFPRMIGGLKIAELGFEADDLTFNQYSKLKASAEAQQINLRPTSRLVEDLRVVKEPEEIALIKRAIAVSDAAIAHAKDIIKPGQTELALAWTIERYMRENGSASIPFEVIVAAGPNAALPHARPSERPINAGETVVIDIGARVEGYVSDLTRTISAGEMEEEFKSIYNIVLQAQTSAEKNIRAGMTGHEADSIARQIIEQAGYGDKFGHGLGHGMGLVVHEEPRLGPNSRDILRNNMVFSVEPGIYLPGRGGIRIEDTVVLRKDRVDVLSRAPK